MIIMITAKFENCEIVTFYMKFTFSVDPFVSCYSYINLATLSPCPQEGHYTHFLYFVVFVVLMVVAVVCCVVPCSLVN
jgi:hypothetical protein